MFYSVKQTSEATPVREDRSVRFQSESREPNVRLVVNDCGIVQLICDLLLQLVGFCFFNTRYCSGGDMPWRLWFLK